MLLTSGLSGVSLLTSSPSRFCLARWGWPEVAVSSLLVSVVILGCRLLLSLS